MGFSSLKDLIISHVSGRYIKIGTANDAVVPYKNKANAGELKWCSLSTHWKDSSRFNKSSVYCNGVKFTNFASISLQTNDKMQIGSFNFNSGHKFSNSDLNLAGTGMFKQGIIDERTILLHHKRFMKNGIILMQILSKQLQVWLTQLRNPTNFHNLFRIRKFNFQGSSVLPLL